MTNTSNFTQFRTEVYQNFNKRADSLMDLLDALCSQTQARSVVELSLQSCFQRSYSAIFKAMHAYRPRDENLAQLAGPYLPPPGQRSFWLLGVDVPPQPRPYARTLAKRGFVYQPTLIRGNKPITIGHQYSTVALLPEKEVEQSTPWVIPLSCQRVKLEDTKALVGAAQLRALLEDETLPFHNQLAVEVGDSDYSQVLFLAANRDYPQLVSLVRCRGNRTFSQKYRAAVRSWQNNWDDLSTFFQFPQEIRRLIYTTNTVEGYHRQLHKVTKNKSSFPSEQAVRKLLYLATRDITKKWTVPIQNWALILNQLAIRFEDRWPV